ncbi:MAG TPA: ABC transporter permease [Gemmatimonadales bacterium]|nr:ABC transporter permease [Gemmatimonadales bacterium]
MSGIPGIRRLFRLVGRDAPVEREIDAELEFHFEAERERLMALGMRPEAARIEARRRFGDLRETRATLARIDRGRRMKERRVSWFEDLTQDLGYALRGFGRQPAFALVIVVTLGLGIGANAVMFGLVDRLLLKPPAHVVNPGNIARFQLTESDGSFNQTWTNESMAWLTFTDQRDHAGYFSDIAAFFTHREMPLGRGAEAGKVPVTLATPSFFRLLGVHPLLGRFYTDEEDRPGEAQAVAVVSLAYANRAFGAPDQAIGKTLFLGSRNYTVIGVAPRGFRGVDLNTVDVWVPFHAGAHDVVGKSEDFRKTYGWQWLNILVRLKPGVSRARASDEATRVQRAAVEKVADVDHKAVAALVPLQGFERQAVSHARERVALWLASVALIVLLIVCANVANLLLARAAGRRREIAVRLALGVGRGRLVRQLLVESLLLAAGGGVFALVLARWGGQLLRATLLPNVTWADSPLDWRVAGVTALATMVTGLLTGLAPAIQASRPALTAALKTGSADAASPRSRLRTGLLALQACLSLVLLVGAGLFVRSLWRVVHTDTGYDSRNLLVANVNLDLAGFDRSGQLVFYDQALERMRALPGVERASLAINSPFWTMNSTRLRLTDRDSTPRIPEGGPYYNGVSPEYFATLGMRLVRGRGFTADDRAGSAPVMIINQRMADFFWPRGEAIGQCIKVGADSLPCVQVVGIVGTARVDAIQEKPRAMYYVPLEQSGTLGMSRDRILFLKARGPAARLVPDVRATFLAMAGNLPLANIRTFQSQIDPEIQPWRLGAVMFGVFGGLALLVAALGLYSVMSYTVVQRTREFGIRSALGASERQIVGSVLRDGLRVVLAGMIGGAALALLGGRFLAPMLYQTSARDPLVFLVVGATLVAASIAAVVVPARRATRVDPLTALRSE